MVIDYTEWNHPIHTQIDFLEDFLPLSQALVQTMVTPPSAYANLPSGSFVIINWLFVSKDLKQGTFMVW